MIYTVFWSEDENGDNIESKECNLEELYELLKYIESQKCEIVDIVALAEGGDNND